MCGRLHNCFLFLGNPGKVLNLRVNIGSWRTFHIHASFHQMYGICTHGLSIRKILNKSIIWHFSLFSQDLQRREEFKCQLRQIDSHQQLFLPTPPLASHCIQNTAVPNVLFCSISKLPSRSDTQHIVNSQLVSYHPFLIFLQLQLEVSGSFGPRLLPGGPAGWI